MVPDTSTNSDIAVAIPRDAAIDMKRKIGGIVFATLNGKPVPEIVKTIPVAEKYISVGLIVNGYKSTWSERKTSGNALGSEESMTTDVGMAFV